MISVLVMLFPKCWHWGQSMIMPERSFYMLQLVLSVLHHQPWSEAYYFRMKPTNNNFCATVQSIYLPTQLCDVCMRLEKQYVYICSCFPKKDTIMESHTSVQSSSFQPLMKNPILRNWSRKKWVPRCPTIPNKAQVLFFCVVNLIWFFMWDSSGMTNSGLSGKKCFLSSVTFLRNNNKRRINPHLPQENK